MYIVQQFPILIIQIIEKTFSFSLHLFWNKWPTLCCQGKYLVVGLITELKKTTTLIRSLYNSMLICHHLQLSCISLISRLSSNTLEAGAHAYLINHLGQSLPLRLCCWSLELKGEGGLADLPVSERPQPSWASHMLDNVASLFITNVVSVQRKY